MVLEPGTPMIDAARSAVAPAHSRPEEDAAQQLHQAVLVAHPTLQHAHQLALALHEEGWLKAFWSGIPVAAPGQPLPAWMPEKFRQKVKRVDIPAALRLHPLRFQLAMQAAQRVPAALQLPQSDLAHRIFHWFDGWAAQRIAQLRPRVVVAYENSAYHTFAAAKAVGARCILDAASLHHQTSADLLNHAPSAFDREVNRRKDAESAMADLILTCSPLAADSYAAHGIPPGKLRPLLLGAELPKGLPARQIHGGPPRFLFAGVLSRRKSVDLILAAFKRLADEGLPYELEFVGNVADASLLDQLRQTPFASYRSGVAQRDLYPLMAAADCLLLPSRFDSFGMVVAEAMACGTPALVSTQTGAKAMIQEAPGCGWIVEPDGDALHAELRRLVLAPQLLAAARPLAQRAAESYTWQAYRERARTAIAEVVC